MEKEEKKNDEGLKEKISKKKLEKHHINYLLIAAFAVTFILGMIVANSLNNATLLKVTDSFSTDKGKLAAEKDAALELYQALETANSEQKIEYTTNLAALENDVKFYEEMLGTLAIQGKSERLEIMQYYKVNWDKYLLVKSGEEAVSEVSIENIATSERTFDLEVRIQSKYNNPILKVPADGSLTLRKGSSGNINLKFDAREPGYAIYELHINDHHAGDILVFVTE